MKIKLGKNDVTLLNLYTYIMSIKYDTHRYLFYILDNNSKQPFILNFAQLTKAL